jgi:hypothetical protein
MASRTGSRLARAFLGYLVGVVILVTLVPFDFTMAGRHGMLLGGSLSDAVANVAMFLPLGFLFRLTRDPHGDRWAMRPLMWGLLFSAAIETVQRFLPSRFSSPLDVLTNGLGAWLGALTHDLIIRRLRLTPSLIGALALELPLMGLVYLLVPLLWLSGLAAFGEPARMGLSLLLGLLGAIVLGAIHRNRFAPAGAVSAGRFAALAAAWYLVGAIPGLVERPLVVLATALVVAAATGFWSGGWAREDLRGDRRFEGETLTRLAPLLGLYLICVAGWPPWSAFTTWHAEAGLEGFWGSADTLRILRALEHLAAFTVVGYAVAEYGGRRERSFTQSVLGLTGWGLGASAALEIVAAFHPGAGASLLRGALAIGTTIYGGGIYHLQRDHIRWLLRARNEAAPTGKVSLPHPIQSGRSGVPAPAGRTD